MMQRCLIVCGAAALCLTVRPLAAQDPRIAERFPGAVVTRLNAVIDSTAREGLPTEPLILRALEGNAKGATPDRIVVALTRLHAALRTARTTIGARAGVTELTTAASALEAGVPTARLVELHKLRAGQTLTAPLGAYLDLVARGAEPDRAWDRIADLAKHRADDAAYRKLSPLDVDHDLPPPSGNEPSETIQPDAVWSLFTRGGTGQLDHLAGGAISASGGSLRQPLGALTVRYDGTAANHTGLGTTGVMAGDIRYPVARGAWQIDAGPTFASGRDINTAWRNTVGLQAMATRSAGPWSFSASLRTGTVWPENGGSFWAGHSAGAAVHVGNFHFGASWQGTAMGDRSVQSTTLRIDTLTAPIDSTPYPSGGIVVRHSYDTTYKHRFRELNDLSLATSWARGALSLQGRIGRRLGLDQQSGTWWAFGGALRLTATVGLTVHASRTSSDPLLRLRGEQSTMIGLRLSTPNHLLPPVNERPAPRAAEISRPSTGKFRVVFTIPGAAQRAAIAGDVTGWRAIALARRPDGRWEVELPALPGFYRINLRLDDGPWLAPPGLPTTDDGFGGTVGLLVLEQ